MNCVSCGKTNYQTNSREKENKSLGIVTRYDSLCISCRGLFNYLTKTKKYSDTEASQMIYDTFSDKLDDRRKLGLHKIGIFTVNVIKLESAKYH